MVRTCPTFWIDFAAHHEHMLHHLNPVSKLCQPGSVEEGTPSTQSQGMGQTWSAPWISTSPNRSAVRKQNKEYPSSPCCCNFSFTSLPSCRVRYGVDGRWILGMAQRVSVWIAPRWSGRMEQVSCGYIYIYIIIKNYIYIEKYICIIYIYTYVVWFRLSERYTKESWYNDNLSFWGMEHMDHIP